MAEEGLARFPRDIPSEEWIDRHQSPSAVSRSGAAIASAGRAGLREGLEELRPLPAASPKRTARRRSPPMRVLDAAEAYAITRTTRTGHSRARVRSKRSAAGWASRRRWSRRTQLAFGYAHLAPGARPTRSSRRVPRSSSTGAWTSPTRACPRRCWPRRCSQSRRSVGRACRGRRRRSRSAGERCAASYEAAATASWLARCSAATERRRAMPSKPRSPSAAALIERTGATHARPRALRVARRAGRRARRRRDARAAAARIATRL